MSRTPITLKGLLKVVGGRAKQADHAYPPPPRWDDREERQVAMAAPTPIDARPSRSLGLRRAVPAPRRVA